MYSWRVCKGLLKTRWQIDGLLWPAQSKTNEYDSFKAWRLPQGCLQMICAIRDDCWSHWLKINFAWITFSHMKRCPNVFVLISLSVYIKIGFILKASDFWNLRIGLRGMFFQACFFSDFPWYFHFINTNQISIHLCALFHKTHLDLSTYRKDFNFYFFPG